MGVENFGWYRKRPRTINRNLRQAIIDALPLDVDEKKADDILRAIFETMRDGLEKDGFVTIWNLGRFYKYFCPAHSRGRAIMGYSKKHKSTPTRVKARYRVKFRVCTSLKRSLYES